MEEYKHYNNNNNSNSSRPNRSDVHLSKEEEAKIEENTRHYFDGIAPKRHTKPQRSEYSTDYSDDNNDNDGVIPESLEFQRLENENQKKLIRDGGGQVAEEFTETEYYKNLIGIDHQHHTTGTGFIKVDNTDVVKTFSITDTETATDNHVPSKGNPATNDWIPAPKDSVDYFSDKPNRSDN